MTKDNVNKPEHYNHNHMGIECIDAIRAALTEEEFKGYIKGNILKYTWREKYKNGIEDIRKAGWYNNKLIEVMNATKTQASTGKPESTTSTKGCRGS